MDDLLTCRVFRHRRPRKKDPHPPAGKQGQEARRLEGLPGHDPPGTVEGAAMTAGNGHVLISGAAARLQRARVLLAHLIEDACPGPHRYEQHRDHHPPWCCACRYTTDGQRIEARTTADDATSQQQGNTRAWHDADAAAEH